VKQGIITKIGRGMDRKGKGQMSTYTRTQVEGRREERERRARVGQNDTGKVEKTSGRSEKYQNRKTVQGKRMISVGDTHREVQKETLGRMR